MKKIAVVILICMLIPVCAGCKEKDMTNDMEKAKTGYLEIKPDEAKKRIDNDEEIIILDVRTLEEYMEAHIPDSILIPYDEIAQKVPDILTNKDATIFAYCRTGRRSSIAAEELVKLGYTDVYNLGGILDWPYDTESGK